MTNAERKKELTALIAAAARRPRVDPLYAVLDQTSLRAPRENDVLFETGFPDEGITSYIRQLTAFDPDSFSFRYTHSKKGAPSLPKNLHFINLRHFAEMIERLADYLDGLHTAVDVLEERKDEMASYGDCS